MPAQRDLADVFDADFFASCNTRAPGFAEAVAKHATLCPEHMIPWDDCGCGKRAGLAPISAAPPWSCRHATSCTCANRALAHDCRNFIGDTR